MGTFKKTKYHIFSVNKEKTPVIFTCISTQLLEKVMTPQSSTLAWKIAWMEEPGRLQSMRSLRVRHNWAISLSLFTFTHWRRKWQPTPVFLPGESQGRGEPAGLPPMGSHRFGHDWSDLAAAAAAVATQLQAPCRNKMSSLYAFLCFDRSETWLKHTLYIQFSKT